MFQEKVNILALYIITLFLCISTPTSQYTSFLQYLPTSKHLVNRTFGGEIPKLVKKNESPFFVQFNAQSSTFRCRKGRYGTRSSDLIYNWCNEGSTRTGSLSISRHSCMRVCVCTRVCVAALVCVGLTTCYNITNHGFWELQKNVARFETVMA